MKREMDILLDICCNSVKIKCCVRYMVLRRNLSSYHKVVRPPEVPWVLTALLAFLFHFDLLRDKRASSSILVSWSKRMLKGFILRRYLTALAFNGFPNPLQFQEVIYIIYPWRRELLLPLGAYYACFYQMTIQW